MLAEKEYPAHRRPATGLPRYSIVIPTYNRREVVLNTLRHVGELRLSWPVEVIVVVDGSTDGSAEALSALPLSVPLRVISQPNAGAAAARNAGARAAQGEIVLFLDDDMIVEADLLLEHEKVYAAGADAVIGDIPIHPDSPPTLVSAGVERWTRRRRERLSRTDHKLQIGDLLTGQLSVRHSVFDALGGFDASFNADGSFGAEDSDFGFRLIRSGADVRYSPDAVAHQLYVVTPAQHLRQWRQGGRADAQLAAKHPVLGARLRASHGGGRFWTALAGISSPPLHRVGSAISRLLVERAGSGASDLPTRWAFTQLRSLSYWLGVREGGGLPSTTAPVRVLAYHGVDDPAGEGVAANPYSVTPEAFEAQLVAVRQAGFEFVTLAEYRDLLGGRLATRPSVLLTFDDGYLSTWENAAPILHRLGIPALVFVVTDLIGTWNRWDDGTGVGRLPLMSRDQLLQLSDQGWEVGSHTSRHDHLPMMRTQRLREDLAQARTALQELGLPAASALAYPYGEHTARVRRLTEKAGYSMGFALGDRTGSVAKGRRYALPRIEVTGATSPQMLVRSMSHPAGGRRRQVQRELRGAVRSLAYATQDALQRPRA